MDIATGLAEDAVVGKKSLQLLGMGRLDRCLKVEQIETGLQKPNYPPTPVPIPIYLFTTAGKGHDALRLLEAQPKPCQCLSKGRFTNPCVEKHRASGAAPAGD